MFKRYIYLIIMIIFVNIPFAVFADDNAEEPITVKIGYSKNYGIIKTPNFENYEGYGYEYLHKITEYTEQNYKLEFVECSLDDGLEMLRNNEIQILAPLNHTDERAEEFIYSESIFAREAMFLTSLRDTKVDDENYSILNNSKIAVHVGDLTLDYLNDFLTEYDINAKITAIEEENYDKDELIINYDYFLSNSIQLNLNLDIAVNLGINDTYFVGNKQSKKIIDDFDNAIKSIVKNEYLYQEQLYLKYFDYTLNNYEHISYDELKTLVSGGPYNVGVTSIYNDFGYNQIEAIAGLPYDIVNMLSDQSGMEIIFNKITNTTVSQMKDGFDFYLNPMGHTEVSEKRTSDPYITSPMIIINNANMNNNKIGVISKYMLSDEVISSLVPNKDIFTYSNIDELCSAFKKEEVDSILIVETSYSCAYNVIQKVSHTIDVTDYQYEAVITFSDDFAQEKIDIINKLITYIDPEDIEIANIRNSSLLSETDKFNFIQTYFRIFVILGIIVIVIFVQTNNNRTKALEKISAYDELTGLYTTKKFIEETRRILNENADDDYSILCVDIDNFKYINEIYSYEVGSNILKTISETITTTLTEPLPVARLSADNFLVLVSTNGLESKVRNYLKIDNPIYAQINEFISEHYSINFSLGSYDIIDKTLDITYMIDCCNLAHSFSKIELGTTYKAFSEDMKTKETTKNSIISRMNQALKAKEFVIFYQPKFDIVTKKITGAEGLVRWFSNGSMIPPNDFIPLFEQNGFIENLDYYVVERACEFIKENPNRNLPVLSVNLSGITIMKTDVVERIMEIVNRYNVSPTEIDLEITESAFVDHFEMAIESIDKFRELGFTISMDDFGAGISSLNRLKEISIDILKIDREFIVGSLQNEKGSTIIRNIILMAKDLRLEIVAEGIETDEQLNFLRNLGCDIGQGYYFSRPLPEADFLLKLDEEI